MKSPWPRIALLCALIAILTGYLAWRESLRAKQASAALDGAQARIVELESKLKNMGSERASGMRNGPAEAVVGHAADVDRPPRPGRRMEMPDFTNDPEIAPLELKQRQRQIANRYLPLFAKLGLSAEQREKLQTLLADKQLSRFDAMRLARRQGLGRDEAMELANQSDAEADASIRTLLGDTAFAQLQDYDRTYAQRATVNGLAAQLNYTGTPLSDTQQEQLIAVLAEHAVADDSAPMAGLGFGPPPGGPGGPGTSARGIFGRDATQADIDAFFAKKAENDADAIAAVSSFLNPSQVEAVRRLQQDENDQLRLAALRVDRVRRAMGGGGGR